MRTNRGGYGLLNLVWIAGASIALGILIGDGGSVPTPGVASVEPAAAASPASATPVTTVPDREPTPIVTASDRVDFADIVEGAMPAVVAVENIQVRYAEPDDGEGDDSTPRRRSRGLLDDLLAPFRDDDGGEDATPDDEGGDESEGEPLELREVSSGSGFVISPDGLILSNNHVIEGAAKLTVVLQDGHRYDAELIGTDPGIDLALLKVDPGRRDLPYLPLGDSDDLRVGEWVIAIGNPLDFTHSVTAGVVSAKDRRVPLDGTDQAVAAFIQTDAAINLGNSGGPLLNAHGQVVGINTAINRTRMAEGIGFALQINDAERSRRQLEEFGYVRRGILGVNMNPGGIDDDSAKYYGLPDPGGVLVREADREGPAYRAGIRPEDVIRSIEGRTIRTNEDLIDAVASRLPGDEIAIEIYRAGRPMVVRASLGERVLDEFGRPEIGTSEPVRRTPQSDTRAAGLGLEVETFDAAGRGRANRGVEGVRITYVALNSVAMDKGVGRDWVITSVNGRPVRSEREWNETVAALDAGDAVQLDLVHPSFPGSRQFAFLTVPR